MKGSRISYIYEMENDFDTEEKSVADFEDEFVDDFGDFAAKEYYWMLGGDQKETLLQKAMLYRHKNPEDWKIRQEESEKFLSKANKTTKNHSFIERFYAKADEALQAKKFVQNLIKQEVSFMKQRLKLIFFQNSHVR